MFSRAYLLSVVIVLALCCGVRAQTEAGSGQSALRNPQSAIVRVAVLELGAGRTASHVSERVAKLFAAAGSRGDLRLSTLDRDMTRAASRGAGYAGSLNMTLAEARSLGASIGCDFYVTGDAETIRRSSTARPVYFESYASIFIVSSRTGHLVFWERPAFEADTAERAEASLLASLDAGAGERYASALAATFVREERERLNPSSDEGRAHVIDLASDDEDANSPPGFREPAPYRRIRPAYTDAAYKAEAEATVDASVEIDAKGEVSEVEIVRWAGFGLDEEVAATVRRMHFRPALSDGEPVAVRVLLRYNFRRPPKAERAAGQK